MIISRSITAMFEADSRTKWDLCRRIRSWRPDLLIVLTDAA